MPFLRSFLDAVGALHVGYGSSAVLTPAEAAGFLPARLLSLPPIVDGGNGLAFQFEPPSRNKCYLFLNREFFPRLELRAFVGEAAGISRKSAKQLVRSGAAHLFHGARVYGHPVDMYLSFKLAQLRRRNIHAFASDGGFHSAIRFRQTCSEIWDKTQQGDVAPRWEPFWPWDKSRLIRSYDQLIVESVNSEELKILFVQMGLDPMIWFSSTLSDLLGTSSTG